MKGSQSAPSFTTIQMDAGKTLSFCQITFERKSRLFPETLLMAVRSHKRLPGATGFFISRRSSVSHIHTLPPRSYVQTNVVGTLNVLDACRDHKVERLIHTSTSETYGSAQYVPIDEKHPSVGQSPYSATKIGADKLAESYWLSFRYAGNNIASVQYLWSTAKSACHHSNHHYPGADGRYHVDWGMSILFAILPT